MFDCEGPKTRRIKSVRKNWEYGGMDVITLVHQNIWLEGGSDDKWATIFCINSILFMLLVVKNYYRGKIDFLLNKVVEKLYYSIYVRM